MNNSIFSLYCELKRLLSKASESEILGIDERRLVLEWHHAIAELDILNKGYKENYDRMVINQSSFTREQIDFICYEIGDWYLEWKDRIIIDLEKGTHQLGYAKEQLKIKICGE